MESKLNLQAIDTYVESYSNKLSEELFQGKESLTGDDILKLPVNQVGLLIINNIFQSWNEEAEKLKSPYFDYENAEVQAELKKLMNLLSKNILVSRSDFGPLLKKAVLDTILLMISPYSFYKSLVEGKDRISISYMESVAKFVKINRQCLGKMIEKGKESPGLLELPGELLNLALGTVDSTPENIEGYVKQFSEIEPFNEESFIIADRESHPAYEEKVAAMSYEDEDEEEEEKSEGTLNDSFISESYESVADELKNSQKTNSLKSMLSINQKFMFINDLFNDSQEDFSKVLDFLETCESKEVATSFIHNNYLKHNIWKANAPQVKEFMALLDKKFDS
ncbi:MAG: hypothetical protein ABFS32_02260 [Bacteroidota bacterium]